MELRLGKVASTRSSADQSKLQPSDWLSLISQVDQAFRLTAQSGSQSKLFGVLRYFPAHKPSLSTSSSVAGAVLSWMQPLI